VRSVNRTWWGRGRSASLHLLPGKEAELDDAALVQALRAREPWAASLFWNRFAPMVYGVLDRALGSASDSEDLTQDVLWRVFSALGSLRDPSALRSFVYSSTLRRLRWHLRSRRVRRWMLLSDSGDLPDTQQTPPSDGREILGRFYRLLDRLGANDRTAFVLRHVEGLTLAEIAQATGTSLATVKRRVRAASAQITHLARRDPELARYAKPSGGSDDT
jgi:RNA polymerase sigma-70 factor (ECF subfamily)